MSKKQFLVYFLCLLSLLLSGCSTTHKKDGPPSFAVDATKIPDAVPKVERLSRIGNKPTYTVFGKKYHVMKSGKNYAAVGIASWYGTKFDNRRTSNGERYDMLAMTAAHRSLPLPTYVQVTNLENGRKVIVKVNDRGPFESNRIIDLSYAAAKKLQMAGRGTALVEIKALDPEAEERAKAAKLLAIHKPHPHCRSHCQPTVYYLDVGEFRRKSFAIHLQQHLAKLLKQRVVIQARSQGSHTLYQLRIGPIQDKRTAAKMSLRLKAIGLSGVRAKPV